MLFRSTFSLAHHTHSKQMFPLLLQWEKNTHLNEAQIGNPQGKNFPGFTSRSCAKVRKEISNAVCMCAPGGGMEASERSAHP